MNLSSFKIAITLYILLFPLFNTPIIFAAPAPEELVFNKEKKQYGIYMAGDEFGTIPLPEGWEISNERIILTLKSSYGECSYDYYDEDYYKKCCKDMGFDYIEPTEIPYNTEGVIKFDEDGWLCIPKESNYVDGLMVNTNENKCTSKISFTLRKLNRTAYPTEGQCKITDEDWVELETEMIEIYVLNTPFGQCRIELSEDTPSPDSEDPSSLDSCAEEWGIEFVGRNLDTTEEIRPTEDEVIIIDDETTEEKTVLLPYVLIAGFVALSISILAIVLSKKVFLKGRNNATIQDTPITSEAQSVQTINQKGFEEPQTIEQSKHTFSNNNQDESNTPVPPVL